MCRPAFLLALLSAAVLASCKPQGPQTSQSTQSPLDIMERVAVGAHHCWFKSGDRAFSSYALAPELTSFSGRPRILLVRKGSGDIRPLLVVQAEGKPAKLDAFGPMMDGDLAPRIRKDVLRWAKGAKGC